MKKNTKMSANSSGKLEIGLKKGAGGPAGKSQPKPKARKK